MKLCTRSHIHSITVRIEVDDDYSTKPIILIDTMLELCPNKGCLHLCRSSPAMFQMIWIDENEDFFMLDANKNPAQRVFFIRIPSIGGLTIAK